MFYNSAYGALPVSFDSAVIVLTFEYKLADFAVDKLFAGRSLAASKVCNLRTSLKLASYNLSVARYVSW